MASFPFNTTLHVYREGVTFRDAKGNTSPMRFFANTAAATPNFSVSAETFFTALVPLIKALTNAAVQSAIGPFTEYGVAQYGVHNTGGAYESVVEKAVFVFQDNSGQLHRFQVPAPKVSIFKADKVTVDPANTDVAAFNTFMTTPDANGVFIVSRQNVALANFMGGIFAGRKLRRRVNILVLEPDLAASIPAE
jgi:hypothetical protein